MLVQMAICAATEFEADAGGAQISGHPLALAGALQKLESIAHRHPMHVPPAAPLAIINPLARAAGAFPALPHPPAHGGAGGAAAADRRRPDLARLAR